MGSPEADGDLVRAIVLRGPGARLAEEELCRRFGPRARLYGLRHLRDEDGARDLAQRVLMALLEAVRAGRIEDADHVDRFVLGICRNVALRARADGARTRPVEDADLDVLSFVPDLERLDAGALDGCLAALDPRARRVIHLSFHEDRSADEIASALAITAGNVRVLRHRAVAQLRGCLEAPR